MSTFLAATSLALATTTIILIFVILGMINAQNDFQETLVCFDGSGRITNFAFAECRLMAVREVR
jgi:hypothetical protein